MSVEILPDTLAFGLPQNSRSENMAADLIEIPTYRETIEEADEILGLPKMGSLGAQQSASVTHSIGIFRALEKETNKKPGIWVAPSIGENMIAERTHSVEFTKILESLSLRQRITEHPLEEGIHIAEGEIRAMFAAAGANPDEMEKYIEEVRHKLEAIGIYVRAFVSNENSEKELVVALASRGISVPDYLKVLKETVGERVANFKTAWLRKIENAFHSPILEAEQYMYQVRVKRLFGENFYQAPDPQLDWFSPMLEKWVTTEDHVKQVYLHPLTPTVRLKGAIAQVHFQRKIAKVIIPDPTNTIPGIYDRNLALYKGESPKVVHLTNRASFDVAAKLLVS